MPADASRSEGVLPRVDGAPDAPDTVDAATDVPIEDAPSGQDGAVGDAPGIGTVSDMSGSQDGVMGPMADAPSDPAPSLDGPAAIEGGAETGTPIDLLTGLLGFWRMNESAGSSQVRDSSGRGHHGVLEGVDVTQAWTAGREGSALHIPFDTREAGVRVATTAAITEIRRFTIAAWVGRPSMRPNSYNGIISRQLGMTDAEVFNLSISRDYLKAYAPDRTERNGVITLTAVTAPDIAPVGRWFHAAATFDGQLLILYQDGRRVGAVQYDRPLPSSTTPLYIATNKNSIHHEPLEGMIDDVLLYGLALPPAAIAALAEGRVPETP